MSMVDVESLRDLANHLDISGATVHPKCSYFSANEAVCYKCTVANNVFTCSKEMMLDISRRIREALGEQEQEPVLAADGLPVVEGETVYYKTGDQLEGWQRTVSHVIPCGKRGFVSFTNGAHALSCDLTHTPPDTQERINEDVTKPIREYWQCKVECQVCPSMIDGKKPYDVYQCCGCDEAMVYDLLRRQREIDARLMGGE